MSVGVVAGFDYLFDSNRGRRTWRRSTSKKWAAAPACTPAWIKDATRCDVFRAQKEYSYRAKQVAGDGWCLVGDAFGFLDPLYSSGVLLALKSADIAGVGGHRRRAEGERRRARRRCGRGRGTT